MKLQTRFSVVIGAIFILLSLTVAVVTVNWVNRHTIQEAESRVSLYIKAAWEVYNSKVDRMSSIADLVAESREVKALLESAPTPARLDPLRARFEEIRTAQNLDVITLFDERGRVILRTRPPYHAGDERRDDPMIRRVVERGEPCAGTILLPADRLDSEGGGLATRCREHGGENEGMLIGAAAPILDGGRLRGIVQVGALLNGSSEKVDRIRDSVFENEQYDGKPVGTATIFMKDLRISTNVRDENGRRAIGTRASPEVSWTLLEEGLSWSGTAQVVNARYLAQYDPIRDPDNRVIGMLYVGELEQKYLDLRTRAVLVNLTIILGGMLLAMTAFFLLARSIVRPIETLSRATHSLAAGDLSHRVAAEGGDEVGDLAASFNTMAEKLEEQQRELQAGLDWMQMQNEELETTNRNYMEMLGFVAHGLKNPLSSAILGIYSIKDRYLGPLNDAQQKGLDAVARSLDHFQDMIRNYLDLSRIEKGEMKYRKRRLDVASEVVTPVVEAHAAGASTAGIVLEAAVPAETSAFADRDLLRIVVDNLVSNGIKYGREGGAVRIEAGAGGRETWISVRNDGAGIAPGQVPLLFRKFSRIENPEHASERGTGVGLFICREIVEGHGGRITVDSKPGAWAEFRVTLPAEEKGATA